MDIRENVKYILDQKGMTQADLARKMGVSKQQIQSYITRNATVESLQRIADALGTTVETIVSETPLSWKGGVIQVGGNITTAKLVCPHCGEEIVIAAK